MSNFGHTPVLLSEVIEALKVEKGQKYIDATLGGGGHSREIIKQGGVVLGIDQDEDAIRFVQENQASNVRNNLLTVVKGNFRNIKKIAEDHKFNRVKGILFDLGVSSFQLDKNERGFSILRSGSLDMRMDQDLPISAYEVVNKYPKEKLKDIFEKYGEETEAAKIADAIVERRAKQQVKLTSELSEIVLKVVLRRGKIHPATKVFQAIRIEVNDEIEALKRGIFESFELLDKNGRLVVISFHSLEDRVVKRFMKDQEFAGTGKSLKPYTVMATDEEKKNNPRSRSAKLRVLEKL